MELRFCDVYQLENGKIHSADSYVDFDGLLRQLAAEPANGRVAACREWVLVGNPIRP
jgi:hypothetical protein